MLKRAHHFWVHKCCYADGRQLPDPAPLLAFVGGLVIFIVFFLCASWEVSAAHRMHASLFTGWSTMLLMGLIDFVGNWPDRVRLMTPNRRYAYLAITSPFFFMWIGMSLFRWLS